MRKHTRKSIRYPGWDYRTPGYYFVTICAHDRHTNHAFGEVQGKDETAWVSLTPLGLLVADCWQAIPTHFAHVALDEWVVMPNHFHGIIQIVDVGVVAEYIPPLQYIPPLPPGSLSRIIGLFKAAVTRTYRRQHNSTCRPVWQRGYWERIVRNGRELNAIRNYIQRNPAKWAADRENLDILLNRMTRIT